MSKTNSAWIFRTSGCRRSENIFLDTYSGLCKSLSIDFIVGFLRNTGFSGFAGAYALYASVKKGATLWETAPPLCVRANALLHSQTTKPTENCNLRANL
jgi:hypothetical protein